MGPAADYAAAKAKQQALRSGQSGEVDEVKVDEVEVDEGEMQRRVVEKLKGARVRRLRTRPVSVRSGTGVKIGRDAMSIYTRISRVKNAKNLDEGLRDRRVVVKVSTKSRDAKKRRQSPREDHENLSVLRSRVNSIIHR